MHGSHKRGRCTARVHKVQRVQRERLTPAPRAKGLCPSGKELCSLERRGRWAFDPMVVVSPWRAISIKSVLRALSQRNSHSIHAESGQQKAVLPHPSTFFTASSRFPVKSIFPKREERGSFSLKSERRQNSALPSLRHRSNTWPPSFLSSER